MAKRRKIRVIMSQSKLDMHGAALRYISHVLKDAGMEVIVSGNLNLAHETPVIREDAHEK